MFSYILLQDNVLNIINQIMDECIPHERANRDFCVKFPEEIRHDNLAGQLWFGAEVSLSCFCFLGLMGSFLWQKACSWNFKVHPDTSLKMVCIITEQWEQMENLLGMCSGRGFFHYVSGYWIQI